MLPSELETDLISGDLLELEEVDYNNNSSTSKAIKYLGIFLGYSDCTCNPDCDAKGMTIYFFKNHETKYCDFAEFVVRKP